jgi:hypothetical protein
MVGITLSAYQIASAPAPVRQWIEQQVTAALRLSPRAPLEAGIASQTAHLAACTEADAAAIMQQLRGNPGALNLLLEFRRPGTGFGQPPIMAFRLMDLLHRTQLESIEQLMECLQLINEAFEQVKGDGAVRFCGFDNEGHCLILPETQRTLGKLWEKMIAAHARSPINGADFHSAV